MASGCPTLSLRGTDSSFLALSFGILGHLDTISDMSGSQVVIIGAGPAGLGAAHQLVQSGVQPLVLEKAPLVGGLARTETYKGYRFDIGGHRFYTRLEPVRRLWEELLGDDFLTVSRLSHIYYRGRLYDYPLNLFNALANLGLFESMRVLLSYVQAKIRPFPEEETFERWVVNRFGRRLYEIFFRTYTEKVWGIPCQEIRADWAAQRIHGLSLGAVISNAIFGADSSKSLITEFRYPRLGPGMMWQRLQEVVEAGGGQVWTNAEAVALKHDGKRVSGLVVRRGSSEQYVSAEQVISSMPLGELVARLDPPAPDDVRDAARALRYRDFIMVALILKRAMPLQDQWIYVHSPEVQVGRIQCFGNWSAGLVPDPDTVSLGLEYFCNTTDAIWSMPDAGLFALAGGELEALGLANPADVLDGAIFRQPQAYPVYNQDYVEKLAFVRGFLANLESLHLVGRNGMHRYNNMDHSMWTGMLAARNVLGEKHDLWAVNTDEGYYEQG
jgi:protoporphyrinogen oxidase